MSNKIKIQLKIIPQSYEILIGSGFLESAGKWAKQTLSADTKKIVVVTNSKVYSLYGEKVLDSFQKAGFDCSIWKIGDGEKFKNFDTLEKTLVFFGKQKLKRTDAVIALGGGIVGDLAGFAAAIYLRGIAFLQIPTTLLAMIDSSVGGKTGVNTDSGKNLLGAFHQPAGVLVDVGVLQTLAPREVTAGFCEAVKQGAIADKKLFNLTKNFLKNFPASNFKTHFPDKDFCRRLENLISAQIGFKAEIIKGDQFEDLKRKDSRSRKILNFGHTIAHALEKVTDYKHFKHGEAVGYGVLAAAKISKNVANLPSIELESLREAIVLAGKLPSCREINPEKVFQSLAFDKKNVGKNLQWILLEKIGKPRITDSSEISDSLIVQSIENILSGFHA